MKAMNIREFLKQFSAEELISKGILRKNNRLLNNESVLPLISLMDSQGVTRLEAPARRWFLTSDGEFQNPRSNESKSSRVESLNNLGSVFNLQNTSINPYYGGSADPELESDGDSDDLGFDLERNLQKALRANIEQLEPG